MNFIDLKKHYTNQEKMKNSHQRTQTSMKKTALKRIPLILQIMTKRGNQNKKKEASIKGHL
jgi:hypothetical protein